MGLAELPLRTLRANRPSSVAIGDLNGDGKPDLATANQGTDENPGKTVSVLANRGDGSFQAKVDYATGMFPWSIAISDLNGDGKPDVVTGNSSLKSVSVLVNDGHGALQPPVNYSLCRHPVDVAIGDLNSDGKPDVATVNRYDNIVCVLLNRGDGSFQAKVDYATGSDPHSVAIGDLNGDGKPDVVTANYAGSSVLLNTTG